MKHTRKHDLPGLWWHTEFLRQAWVWGQPKLQSMFQDRFQSYTNSKRNKNKNSSRFFCFVFTIIQLKLAQKSIPQKVLMLLNNWVASVSYEAMTASTSKLRRQNLRAQVFGRCGCCILLFWVCWPCDLDVVGLQFFRRHRIWGIAHEVMSSVGFGEGYDISDAWGSSDKTQQSV